MSQSVRITRVPIGDEGSVEGQLIGVYLREGDCSSQQRVRLIMVQEQ